MKEKHCPILFTLPAGPMADKRTCVDLFDIGRMFITQLAAESFSAEMLTKGLADHVNGRWDRASELAIANAMALLDNGLVVSRLDCGDGKLGLFVTETGLPETTIMMESEFSVVAKAHLWPTGRLPK